MEDDNGCSTNPKERESNEKGKSKESGGSLDFSEQLTTNMAVTDLENSNSNVSTITRTEDAKHVDIKNINGPQLTKPRPTWTRITRVDHGLGNLIIEELVVVLGKRGVY